MAVETMVITVGSANQLQELEKKVNEYLKEKDKKQRVIDAPISIQFLGVYLAALTITKTEASKEKQKEKGKGK